MAHHPTAIVVVLIACGSVFLLGCLSVALCWLIKKKKKTVKETDIVHIDGHRKVQEVIVPGPHGRPQVVLSVEEDDVHFEEDVKKQEMLKKGLHGEGPHKNIGKGVSSSEHHQLELENKA